MAKHTNKQNQPELKDKYKKKVKVDYKHQKLDESVPRFTIKGSMVLILIVTTGSFIVPLILGNMGMHRGWAVVLGSSVISSFGVVYTRFFIETKRGFCKKFWIQYVIYAFVFGIFAFYWGILRIAI